MTPPDRLRSIADLGPQSINYLAVTSGAATTRRARREPPAWPGPSGKLQRMRTTAALLVTLALTLPSVAVPHPCEVEVARMNKDLEAIRGAIATIEGVRPSDVQRQMLTGAKGKYDLELSRTTEAQARCERLVREESRGATPLAAPAVAASAVPQEAASATPAAPAPAAAVLVAPAAQATPRPAGPSPRASPAATRPEASATPATPCLTGCGKDTDCKGDRICVKGACQDPPSR